MPASYIITQDKNTLIITLSFDRKRLESESSSGGRDGLMRAADEFIAFGINRWEKKLERAVSPFQPSPIEQCFKRLLNRIPDDHEITSFLIRLKCEECETEHNFEGSWLSIIHLYRYAKQLHTRVTCDGVLREKLIMTTETNEYYTEDWLNP